MFELRYEARRFDRYVFGDLRQNALASRQAEVERRYPDAAARPQIVYRPGDANALIASECSGFGPRDRAVMFLDPFGMQVAWAAIERIAGCRAIDLWYLAPTGIALNRLMPPSGRVRDGWRPVLDRSLGPGWAKDFYSARADMLGDVQHQREQGCEAIIAGFEKRWRWVSGDGAPAAGGVRLRAGSNLPCLLCFACTNPSPSERKAALGIAESLIRSARDGRLV